MVDKRENREDGGGLRVVEEGLGLFDGEHRDSSLFFCVLLRSSAIWLIILHNEASS